MVCLRGQQPLGLGTNRLNTESPLLEVSTFSRLSQPAVRAQDYFLDIRILSVPRIEVYSTLVQCAGPSGVPKPDRTVVPYRCCLCEAPGLYWIHQIDVSWHPQEPRLRHGVFDGQVYRAVLRGSRPWRSGERHRMCVKPRTRLPSVHFRRGGKSSKFPRVRRAAARLTLKLAHLLTP